MRSANALQLAKTIAPPDSWRDFTKRFRSDADCEAFLFEVHYPDGFRCPRCDSTRGWRLKGRRLVECESGHKVSLTAGTLLHGTRQPLLTWFAAVYLITTLTPGISALQFQRQMGVRRYETAFELLHKVRAALVAPAREPLRREVEVDEVLIGGKDADRGGRSGDMAVVAGAVEVLHLVLPDGQMRTRAGRVRLQALPDASTHSLVGLVKREVERGAIVHTDGWDPYRQLGRIGYDHRRLVQGRHRTPTAAMPHLHRIFSNLKGWIAGTHHGRIEPRYLQAYLDEYTFRFNRRFGRGPAFLRALVLLAGHAPKHYI